MSGRVVLGSPWCRQGLPPEQRPDVEAAVPDGTFLNVACGSSGPGKPWMFRLLTDAKDATGAHELLWGPLKVWNKPLREAALFALAHKAEQAA